MSFKKPYLAIALVGVAAASGAAWWLQNKPTQPTEMVATPAGNAGAGATPAGAPPASGVAGAPAAGGPARPMAVEVAKVEKAMLVDETQSVGSLKSNQGVVLRPEVGGRVSQVLFKDGQRVKKGQLLVQFDDQLPAAQKAEGYKMLLNELVLEKLVSSRASAVEVKDEQVDARIEQIKSRFPSPEAFEEQLKKAGQTVGKLREDVTGSI
ncbi:MAG: Multidrug resistance protein MdtA precursor, partial [Pseudomonadota bacterium]